jgi:LysM repeat protein
MSSKLLCIPWVRLSGGLFILLACVLLSGCYTRQIEGIQSDLDSLDRKLHTLNNKKSPSPQMSKKSVVELEDRLNKITLQQADVKDAVAALRKEYSGLKTDVDLMDPESFPGSGARVESDDLRSVKKSLERNQKETDRVARDVADLKKTFESLRDETQSVIGILIKEFGPEGSAETVLQTPAPTSTTNIEEPGGDSSPAFPDSEATVKVGKSYHVNPGDSLISISRKFGVSSATLKEINGIEDPNHLKMGQTIYLP